jgi:hypothetical protein
MSYIVLVICQNLLKMHCIDMKCLQYREDHRFQNGTRQEWPTRTKLHSQAVLFWIVQGLLARGCHQNQIVKNIGNLTTLFTCTLHNIGTHLKGIETSFQVVPLFWKSFHFWVSYITFWNLLKIPCPHLLMVQLISDTRFQESQCYMSFIWHGCLRYLLNSKQMLLFYTVWTQYYLLTNLNEVSL